MIFDIDKIPLSSWIEAITLLSVFTLGVLIALSLIDMFVSGVDKYVQKIRTLILFLTEPVDSFKITTNINISIGIFAGQYYISSILKDNKLIVGSKRDESNWAIEVVNLGGESSSLDIVYKMNCPIVWILYRLTTKKLNRLTSNATEINSISDFNALINSQIRDRKLSKILQ